MTIFSTYLQKKIKKNMKEWKAGRWVSQKQALAVSYSQTRAYMKRRKTRSRKCSRKCSRKYIRKQSPRHKRSNLKKSKRK